MPEEPFAQRIERLVQECNVPALLAETQQLLTLYLDGDDNLDLEPITSALSILQRAAQLQPQQDYWHKKYPITSITRADLVPQGVDLQALSQNQMSDAYMQAIASRMEDRYRDGAFWDDLVGAVAHVEELKATQPQLPQFPEMEL